MSGRILLLFLFMLPLVCGNRCKRGFGHWKGAMQCGDFAAMNPSFWWYDRRCNWQYYYDNDFCASEIENYSGSYLATYWNFDQNTPFTCHHAVNKSGVIGPWKPNRKDNGNLTPAELAAHWLNFQSNSTYDYALIGPTIAPCGYQCVQGLTELEYLAQFLGNCSECRIDFINAYTESCNATKTMEYFKTLYDMSGKPVWATNLICRSANNNAAEVLAFMNDILPRLDDAFYIGRYAWAEARIASDGGWYKTSASLFNSSDSTFTNLGLRYNQIP